jgi:hypothetical protein
MVKAKLFQEQKEVEKEVEEKRKYDIKVKRVANTLKKVKELEEKEARAATRQLVVDLKKANPVVKKSSTAYAKLVGTTLKKNISIMLKA